MLYFGDLFNQRDRRSLAYIFVWINDVFGEQIQDRATTCFVNKRSDRDKVTHLGISLPVLWGFHGDLK